MLRKNATSSTCDCGSVRVCTYVEKKERERGREGRREGGREGGREWEGD